MLSILCCCFGSSTRERTRPIRSNLADWREHPLVAQYQLVELLGEGGFSEVWLGQHKDNGHNVAIKVVYLSRPGLTKEQAAVLESEAKYLRMLQHPNILHCQAVLETKYDLVMVLEHLQGGELLDYLHTIHHFSEHQAATLFRQVVEAVAYMHSLNIIHRDLKPENIMFAKPVTYCQTHGKPLKVKLIDLGMAIVDSGGKECESHLHGCLGSPGFIAPEVVRGGRHTMAMDIYALGCILFVMLTGRKPFELRDVQSLRYASMSIRDAPGLKDPYFLSASEPARSLMLWMMADNPGKRPTADQVLSHPWVSGLAGGGARRVIDDVVRRRMAQLANLRKYRGLAFALMHNAEDGLYTLATLSRNSRGGSQSRASFSSPSQAHLTRHANGSSVSGPVATKGGPSPALERASASSHTSGQLHHSPTPQTPGKLEGPDGRSFTRSSLSRRSLHDTFFTALTRQRKVMYQEMRARARTRELQPSQAAGPTPGPGKQLSTCAEEAMSSNTHTVGGSVHKQPSFTTIRRAQYQGALPVSLQPGAQQQQQQQQEASVAESQPLLLQAGGQTHHKEWSDHPVHLLRTPGPMPWDAGRPMQVSWHDTASFEYSTQQGTSTEVLNSTQATADGKSASTGSTINESGAGSERQLRKGSKSSKSHKHIEAGGVELGLIATAVLAAPDLGRSWSAPEVGDLPNLLENAVGAGHARASAAALGSFRGLEVGEAVMGTATSGVGVGELQEEVRALSLNPLALAFLGNQDALIELLGGMDVYDMLQEGRLSSVAAALGETWSNNNPLTPAPSGLAPLQAALGGSGHLSGALRSAGPSQAAVVLQHLVQSLEQKGSGSVPSTTAADFQQGSQKEESAQLQQRLVQEGLLQQASSLCAKSSITLQPAPGVSVSRNLPGSRGSGDLASHGRGLSGTHSNASAQLSSNYGSQVPTQVGPTGDQAVLRVSSGALGEGLSVVHSLRTVYSLESRVPVWRLPRPDGGPFLSPQGQQLLVLRQPSMDPTRKSGSLAHAVSGIMAGTPGDLGTVGSSGGCTSTVVRRLSGVHPPSSSSGCSAAHLAAQGLALLRQAQAAGNGPSAALSPAPSLALHFLRYPSGPQTRQLINATAMSTAALAAQRQPPVGLLVALQPTSKAAGVGPEHLTVQAASGERPTEGWLLPGAAGHHQQESPAMVQNQEAPVLPANQAPLARGPQLGPAAEAQQSTRPVSKPPVSSAQLSESEVSSPHHSACEPPSPSRALRHRHPRHLRTSTCSSITSPFASFSQLPMLPDMSALDSAPTTPCHLSKTSNISTPAANEEQS